MHWKWPNLLTSFLALNANVMSLNAPVISSISSSFSSLSVSSDSSPESEYDGGGLCDRELRSANDKLMIVSVGGCYVNFVSFVAVQSCL